MGIERGGIWIASASGQDQVRARQIHERAFLLALGILALWCLGSASGIAAFALGRRGASGKRLAASVGLSALALAVAWLGMSRLNLKYSRTVNGAGWEP